MNDESGLSHNESLQFRGLARVDLATLNFEHASSRGHRDSSEPNVKRLINIFRKDRCRRCEAANFVKVRVNQEQLDAVLASQNLHLPQQPPKDWKAFPVLNLPSIDCLNGLHRVLPARQYLDKNDQWWVARVYIGGPTPCRLFAWSALTFVDLQRSCCKSVAEEFINEKGHSNGEIFRKIRDYHKNGEGDDEGRWWARLSKDNGKDLRQLLKDERFERVFDAMLSWPGLFRQITLRLSVRLKCDEVGALKRRMNHG